MESVDTFTLNLIDTYLKDKVKNPEFEESMMITLFRDQKFDLIIYALDNGFEFNAKVISLLQQSGEIKLYQYLQKCGININLDLFYYRMLGDGRDDSYLDMAVRKGRIDTVKWMYELGVDFDGKSFKLAMKYGHLDIAKWMESIKSFSILDFDLNTKNRMIANHQIIRSTIKSGNLESLKWLCSKLPMYFEKYIKTIVKAGHLHILEWMLEFKNWELDFQRTFHFACQYHNLEIMKWCVEHLHSPDMAMAHALSFGNLEFLIWVKEKYPSISFTPLLLYVCSQANNLKCLKWLIENGCPYDLKELKRQVKHPEIIAYLWALKD